jgi:hypothetical protein
VGGVRFHQLDYSTRKIQKRVNQSVILNRLTDNTMINKKRQKASNGRENTTQKIKDIAA